MSRPPSHFRRRLAAPFAALVMAAGLADFGVPALPAQPAMTVAREYQVKGVFLFNFTQFVDWPAAAFASPEAPLIIGVLGQDPFGALLDDAVRGEKVQGRSIEIRRGRTAAELTACHVLYLSPSEDARLAPIFATLRGRPLLTVGESPRFTEQGGMISFFTERNRVRLRINPQAARDAGLTISSKLLRPAEIVNARPQ